MVLGTPLWPGRCHPWRELAGFSVYADGVALQMRGRPWTRWVGPVLPREGWTMHEVVRRLDRAGGPRLDG